ncbi:ABC transporter ATP-binding protein [Rhodoferax sp.]|uniref:ABC transporter ATP-binding protein n=1 Tax=Rhodoferax sp. TaxID=50421 RepID=UPI00262FC19A|nr:ABC transporter ATP-binding protein [Rhodoferax sp.]MDD5478443.1 ABC transporter ATP-binding protein [Rhodoferax sp.]
MTNGSIQLHGVGKYYKRYASNGSKAAEIFSFGCLMRHTPHWVLKNIDLTIATGEAVALLGYNGAGKSTLLKLIAGTTTPSAGSVHLEGRLAAILELGIGFHPELTGHQNIRMAGRLMGLSGAEITASLNDIATFSELSDRLDEPLRTYSSGMLARLAFSIATAIRPDILIVDEVLSVGDAYFQHKSFARIREFRRLGTTLLFVSHDFGAIRALCDRVVLIENGTKLKDGNPSDILDFYHALVLDRERKAGIIQQTGGQTGTTTQSGGGEIKVEAIELLGRDGAARSLLNCGESSMLRLACRVYQNTPSLVVGIMFRDKVGNPVFGTNSHLMGQTLTNLQANELITIEFEQTLDLGAGSYSVSFGLTDTSDGVSHTYDWKDGALVFELINRDYPPCIGMALLKPQLTINRTSDQIN